MSASDRPALESPHNRSAIGDQIFRVTRRLRQASAAATEPLGLSPHQIRAMHVLLRCGASADGAQVDCANVKGANIEGASIGGARLSELADRLRVAPRSATEVVDGLEDKGLVARHPDPGDRRAIRVALTATGRQRLAEADAARGAVHARMLAALTPDEQKQLGALLAKLEAGDDLSGEDRHNRPRSTF